MNKPTVISYSRVSSAKQVSGTGLSQQRDQNILNQLSTKYDLPIDDRSFSDEGLSGFHSHNLQGDFGRILELIGTGSIAKNSILAITSLDRLSRAKTNEAMELMLSVINRGIRIYTAMDDKLYSSDSPNLTADLIVSVIIIAQAHEESLKKSHRVRGNAITLVQRFLKGERASDGYPIAIKSVGKLPWWIDASSGSVRPHDYYFPIAQWVANQMLLGKGNVPIVNELNEEYTPPNGKQWNYRTFTRFTNGKAITGLGVFTIDGEEYELPDYFPQVVSEEDYYRIKAIKSKFVHSNAHKREPTIASGIGKLKCRCCHGPLGYQISNQHGSYRCINGMRNKSICGGVNVGSDLVDLAIREAFSWMHIQPKPVLEDKLTPLQAELSDMVAKLNQVEQDYSNHPSSALGRVLVTLENEVEDLKQQVELASINQQAHDISLDLPTSVEEWRYTISSSVDGIYVYRLGSQKILVSIYFTNGMYRHVVVHKGKIVFNSGFSSEPEVEERLKERTTFLLHAANGDIERWINAEPL